MEQLDIAYSKLVKFVENAKSQYGKTISEADARLKLIDPIFIEILGWPLSAVSLEGKDDAGRYDYLFSHNGFNLMLVEAKRVGRPLGINDTHAGRYFKLDGPVFKTEAADQAISQLVSYCACEGAELACATNGIEWFVFLGTKPGHPPKKGVGCVFGNLDAVISKFGLFYDLLSFEGVREKRYKGIFHEAEGRPIRRQVFCKPIRSADTAKFIESGPLAMDLDRVMISFFQELSGQDDPEARRACFVTTSESAAADANLTRISDDLRNSIQQLSSSEPSQITEVIQRSKEMQRHEIILLVGTKGAGKSTFIDRFFLDVLPENTRKDCIIVRIDLAECGGNSTSIVNWLNRSCLKKLEHAAFNGHPSFEELQGMYWNEYQRWKNGHAKQLYKSNKDEFKIQFGQYIEDLRNNQPNEYIVMMLQKIVHGFSKVPCLVFDNADHFDVAFQQEVFKFTHALYTQTLMLAILPITDTTSWQLSKQGAMQSFFTEAYYLPTPPIERVLERRIEFIETKINEEEGTKSGYFLGQGIPLLKSPRFSGHLLCSLESD